MAVGGWGGRQRQLESRWEVEQLTLRKGARPLIGGDLIWGDSLALRAGKGPRGDRLHGPWKQGPEFPL